ncbi:MAG: carbohydrate binding family 9 domain-containing protein [Bacteroidetes bacterium]|nr:carbohydrate binding family 9 domain-containing protein [Bacteroidota bacterium]
MQKLVFFFLFVLGINQLNAFTGEIRSLLAVALLDAEIVIDGQLNPSEWELVLWTTAFTQNYPSDTSTSNVNTKVALGHSNTHLYVAAICYFPKENNRTLNTLKRDFSVDNNDAFSLILDPTLDGNNGAIFSVTPSGVMQEGLISFSSRVDNVWDNKWIAAAKVYDTCWTLEMKIPFKSIRYTANQTEWGINFVRTEIAINERSAWNRVPREFDALNLGYCGRLVWQNPPPKPTLRAAIIPYVTAGVSGHGQDINTLNNAGLDLKSSIGPSLNLDVTVNPDFSQVEVDQQVINLERFSVFFPERRNFFIENNDLFSNFGFSKIRPFFSRRIGIDPDGGLVPIYAGARLSGKLNQDWRIGLLNMQTQAANSNELPQNYSVACFQKRTIGSSNISGILVNRQGVGANWQNDYNRIIGMDYNILSQDNRWRGKVFYHQSFSNDNSNFQYAHASWLRHTNRTFSAEWNHEFVSKWYQADVGFVPREGTGYWRLEPWVQKRFYPKSKLINYHGPKLYYSIYTDEEFDPTDATLEGSYQFVFQNTSQLYVNYTNSYVRLTSPFNPNRNDTVLFEVGEYSWRQGSFNFAAANRKNMSLSFYGSYGSFYKGYLASFGGNISYRIQPYVRMGIDVNMNQLLMPAPHSNDNLMLIRPSIDVSFNKKLFWSALAQLNRQTNTLFLNSRLQWRFAPMSDLFIVYNHNFSSENFSTINQALLIKLNYWLNI